MIPEPSSGRPHCGRSKSIFQRWSEWFRQVQSDLGKKSDVPGIKWVGEFILPLLIGAILTMWIRMSGIDLRLQQLIFESGGDSWAMGNHLFWTLLYRHGTLPAVMLSILGLIGFILSYVWKSLRPWRRIFLFILLTMVVGPGVIVNAGLKDNWGRPRPKEVIDFGGEYHFEPVLTIDSSSPGNSFPSGHAAMGFFFLSAFFIFRRHRRDLAGFFLMTGLGFGTLMGISRMIQGGHFLSDVVWAGLITYFASMGLYFALGLNRNLLQPPPGRSLQLPLRKILWGIPLVLLILAGIALGTPYRARWEASADDPLIENGVFDLQLVFSVGEVEIVPSEKFGITMEAKGLGLPTSRIKRNFLTNHKRDCPEVVYMEEMRGWFSQLNSKVRVQVPWDRVHRIRLNTADADVRIVCGRGPADPEIEVIAGRGKVRVVPAGQSLKIEDPHGRVRVEPTANPSLVNEGGNGTNYDLNVRGGFSGWITIEAAPASE